MLEHEDEQDEENNDKKNPHAKREETLKKAWGFNRRRSRYTAVDEQPTEMVKKETSSQV